MSSDKPDANEGSHKKLLAEILREQEIRSKGYREQALKLFPHVCGSCGREFSGKRLKELTVHHRDHNHDNNPADGSNWELLCIYCHDHEHEKTLIGKYYDRDGERTVEVEKPKLTTNPFDKLDAMLKPKKEG